MCEEEDAWERFFVFTSTKEAEIGHSSGRLPSKGQNITEGRSQWGLQGLGDCKIWR